MATCLASSSATIRIVKLAQCRSRPAVRPSLSRHTIFCRASSNTGSPNDSSIGQQAAQKLQEVIENARPHAERLGRNASAKMKQTAVYVDDEVRRAAAKVDQNFGVREKAAQAADGLRTQAEEVDKQLGIRRGVRNLREDAQRKWPTWRRQWIAFQGSLPGQLFLGVLLFYAFSSGLAWRVLHFFWLVSWLAPLLLLPVLRKMNKQAATERAATAAQQAEEVKRANSPFGGWPFNGPARSGGSAGRSGVRAPSPYQQQNNGPVVDAEFYTIDEGDE